MTLFIFSLILPSLTIKNLENYPNNIEEDLVLLEEVGCDLTFIPKKVDMYPQNEILKFNLNGLDCSMEGAHEPGHLMMCTIISKFFEVVQPKNAYFDQKTFSN